MVNHNRLLVIGFYDGKLMGCLALALAFFLSGIVNAQNLRFNFRDSLVTDGKIEIYSNGFSVTRPFVSYQVGTTKYSSSDTSPLNISIRWKSDSNSSNPDFIVTFLNKSRDTLHLHNVVPFAPGEQDVFITGKGNHRLSRTHLFRPGRLPVNVIVPDNAWELGYCSFNLKDSLGIFGLMRRDLGSLKNAERKRFETIIAPGGSVTYFLYSAFYNGPWQKGLQKCFQEKKLYDADAFDETLYRREDLKWIRSAYVMHLMMAWDKDYYDVMTGRFNWNRFMERGQKLYGGDDVICLWPTWPTLGLDPRNQFDMYRDLPGGLKTLRMLADSLRKHNTKFFIAYNPWDESTRSEGHLQGLADLIRETSADGVVLDTKGESSKELQQAADKVKPGVIMYSEGMAVPKDMGGIVSGRVHNALYYPPMLNLNKLIRPDFAIFRVAEVFKEPIRREYAVAFFNGYGTEINQFSPGHPEWEEEQYKFLGKTSRILRENSANFISSGFMPLVTSLHDSIWVNHFSHQEKSIYTIFSLKPEGFKGKLFKVNLENDDHLVDLWNHEELKAAKDGYVEIEINAFNRTNLGTNNEGATGCIAIFKDLMYCDIVNNRLNITSLDNQGTTIKVWAGAPDYSKKPVIVKWQDSSIALNEVFERFEGKIVVQLFRGNELLDENVLTLRPGEARLISQARKAGLSQEVPKEMVRIPAGNFKFKTTHGDDFIPYPANDFEEPKSIHAFLMDRFPVTNKQFKEFLDATHYQPSDTANFLKHWKGKRIQPGEEQFPVVFVSYEDAQVYARWAGKRLPTEVEWQYAAQTPQGNEWPWKQSKPVVRKEQVVTNTLTVSVIEGIDPRHCNLGDGKLYPVGRFPKGANPYGLQDLVGCVWQLTNDVYESGSYRYIMMKGGSYFKPSSSWWYVQGGPRELHYRQYLLRVSQGFERNATVGFRCVKDSN